MHVLVTGGAGYIGSVCVEILLKAGFEVTAFDNLSEGHREAVDPRARFIQGDLAHPEDLDRAMQGASAVMHFAASALVGESMTDPAKYFRNNVVNGLNLLEAARRNKIKKFVFSSTCATYGPPDRLPMTEDLPQRPINPYGESKLMFEKMLRWYREIHGLKFVGFRYFNAAGATKLRGEHHRIETHLIPNVLKVALNQRSSVEIFGTDYSTPDGTCVRDYIHVADIAHAHIASLREGIEGFYNLGNGDGYSVKQVVETCERVTGQKIPIVMSPRRPGDPSTLVAGANLARRDLNWTPVSPDLESIVQSAWDWHRSHPTGYT